MTKHAKQPIDKTAKVAMSKPCLIFEVSNERFSVKNETNNKASQNQIFDNVNFNLPINLNHYIGVLLIKQERTLFLTCLKNLS